MSRKKPDLTVKWSKRENALMYNGSKQTGGMTAYIFETKIVHDKTVLSDSSHRELTFIKELEDRGYDITTLKFSIYKKSDGLG